MQVENLRLEGLKLIAPRVYRDERGFFFELFSSERYAEHGISTPFVQDNCSFSKKDTIRALHFQSDPGQAKLVSCIYGTIWDVAVDIRTSSLTFGKWEAALLDDVDHRQLFVPVGFAHGFCVLSDGGAIVKYKTSSYYNGATERSIRWNDPDIAVQWPAHCPNLSDRDRVSPFFKEIVFK